RHQQLTYGVQGGRCPRRAMCIRKKACRQLLSNSMLDRHRFFVMQWSLGILVAVLGHSPASLRADTKRFVLDAPGNGLPDEALSLFERDTAKLTTPSQAKKLLRLTASPVAGPKDVNLPITD